MEFQKDELNEILNIFQQESTEIISSMDGKLLVLEKDASNKDVAMQLFRDAHSLKGSARMLGFDDIQTLAHKIEDIISLIKDDKLKITSKVTDVISECLEFISTLVNKTVELREEYKSLNLYKYIEKLESITDTEKREQDYININSDLEPSKKEFLLKFEELENIIIEVLYIVSLARAESDYDLILKVQKKIADFSMLINGVDDEDIYSVKNSYQNILNSIDKFSMSDNKPLSFLEVNECVTSFIEVFCSYVDKQKIQRKEYYEIVENLLNDKRLDDASIEKIQTEEKIVAKEVGVVKFDKIDEFLQRIPLLEINCEFYNDAIELAKQLIEKEQDKVIKQIFVSILEILKSHKDKNIVLKQDLATGLKDILFAVKTMDKDVIDEAKLKADVFEKMSKFQNNIKSSQNKINEKQKDILNTITNTEIKTLRVESDKLDSLVGQIGELIVSKIKTNEQLSLVKKINNDLIDWQKNFSKMSYYIKYFDRKYLSNPFEIDNDYRKMIAHNKQLAALIEQHSNKITNIIKETSYLFKQLQESETKLNSTTSEIEVMVKNMRILPLSIIFQLFPRMVHNIARDRNKKIDLVINGADVSADKTIIEELKIPLMHIIRNAIDHGIEDVATRKALGKNPIGKIEINASYKDGKIIVDVKDDGRGLDIEKIKAKALEKEILTKEEAGAISDDELMNLIFYPGFSTEDFVTEISGRGLGLDIVNNKISHMQGRIDIFSQLNQGTMVRVILPATVATKKVFVIREQNQLWAIETSAIKTIIRVHSDEIFEKDNNNYYIYDKNPIVVHTLSQILNFENTPRETEKYTLLIIETENATFGVIVEKLISDQEIVHKKLAPPLYKVKHISGITTLASGDACLILSLSDIIATIGSKKIGTKIISKNGILKTKDNFKYKILIVDDSPTTRILQKNILFNCGYNVSTATNPINALDRARSDKFDLVISDIQMPQMTGFEFIAELRAMSNYRETPVFVVSSEDKEKYTREIHDLNILEYVQKSDFNQTEMVEKVERVLNY